MPQALRQLFGVMRRSYIALAILSFLLLDFAVRSTYCYWHHDRFSSPNRSWAWWAVQDMQKQQHIPDILLLGSSLMLSVVHDGDATYLKQSQDAVYHHRSYYLEHLLKQKSVGDLTTFSMAIGGQMASDAFAIVSTLFNSTEHPRVIVYGIAPRDFIDSMFLDPATTETYRFMTKAGNRSLTATAGHNSFWNKTNSAAESACFLYDKRLDFVEIGQRWTRCLLSQCLNIADFDTVKAPVELKLIAKFNQPEDAGPNQWLASPHDPSRFKFRDNLPEYRQRYSLFKPKVYKTQIAYFERFLKYCRDAGIGVVLVNMPITNENMEILPAGIYRRYSADVAKLAQKYDARLVDFNKAGTFDHSQFADSVHVNGLGAVRFLELLSDNLLHETQIAAVRSQNTR